MIFDERILKILLKPHFSEKTSINAKKNNTLVLQVHKNAKKFDIKKAIEVLFQITVEKVNTLVVKGKRKRYKNRFYQRSNWKKAYITLKKGQNLDALQNKV